MDEIEKNEDINENINENMNDRKSRISKRREKKEKTLVNKISTFLLFFVFIPLLLFSGSYILRWYIDTKKSEKATQEVMKEIEKSIVKEDGKNKVDLSKFKKINKDSKGVIEIEAVDIKNVFVQTNNNDYYLNHDFNKRNSMAGWIYVDYRNKLDGFDKNILIYGHNMRDGKTMFTPLTKMLDVNLLKNLKSDKKYVKFLTEDGEEKYQIFSVYAKPDRDINLNDLLPKSKNELNELISKLKKKSIFDFKVDIEKTDQIITVMTCGRTNAERVVVHAVRIDD